MGGNMLRVDSPTFNESSLIKVEQTGNQVDACLAPLTSEGWEHLPPFVPRARANMYSNCLLVR